MKEAIQARNLAASLAILAKKKKKKAEEDDDDSDDLQKNEKAKPKLADIITSTKPSGGRREVSENNNQ